MKFKLIKEYPESPQLSTIVTQDERGQYVSPSIEIFSKDLIESFPEFWQKVEDEKKDVLSTTDGFELTKGEKYYLVSKHSFKIHEAIYDGNKPDENHWIAFLIYILAEDYSVRNKPCLSYIEVVELLKNNNITLDAAVEIFKIAESRI